MIVKVYQAINAVQRALSKEGITKDRTASGFGAGYAFRGIDDVYNTLSPLLSEHGLVIIPRCMERHESQRQSGPKTLYFVVVRMEFDFVCAEDGSKHTACTYGEAMDSGDKATNKAMSIAYKYACFQTFAIPTEGDNDPDATIHEPAPARKQPQNQPVPQPERPAPVNQVIDKINKVLVPDALQKTESYINSQSYSQQDKEVLLGALNARRKLLTAQA